MKIINWTKFGRQYGRVYVRRVVPEAMDAGVDRARALPALAIDRSPPVARSRSLVSECPAGHLLLASPCMPLLPPLYPLIIPIR
jgi:hypothetical protein